MKVSIVMPTYNRYKSGILNRTVKSVLNQKHTDWELLISNNGIEKIEPFKDKRIKIFNNSEQKSASYARNKVIPFATGELLCYFDDDDEMLPNYLSDQVAIFSNKKVQAVRCGMRYTNGKINYSLATPLVMMYTKYAEPIWGTNILHDQIYFKTILGKNKIHTSNGKLFFLKKVLSIIHHENTGGRRGGAL